RVRVAAAGQQPLAVRREGGAAERVGVVAGAAQFLAGLDVPDAEGAVVAGGDDPLAVGRDGDGPDAVLVAGQAAQLAVQAALDAAGQVAGAAADLGVLGGRAAPQGRQGRLADLVEAAEGLLAAGVVVVAELPHQPVQLRRRVG